MARALRIEYPGAVRLWLISAYSDHRQLPYSFFTIPLSSISFKIDGSMKSLGLRFFISGRVLASWSMIVWMRICFPPGDVLAKQKLDFIWRSKPSARSRNCFFVSLVVRSFADFVANGRIIVKKSMFFGVSYSVIFSALVFAQGLTTEAAKTLFAQYVALEHAYDANIAELYADDALIKNKRIYPAGDVREITMPAVNYKTLLRQAMPIAKVRGDRSTYSQVTYTLEGERVRIQASRFSELKSHTSPISLLVGPSKSGKWLIYEELSESRP